MPIYEKMTEQLLREADQMMVDQWDSRDNNFRKAINNLERLRSKGMDPQIYWVTHGNDKGGILLVNKAATEYKKVNS